MTSESSFRMAGPDLCNVSYMYLLDETTLEENHYNTASSFVGDVTYDCYTNSGVCAYYLYEITGRDLIDNLKYIMTPQHYEYAQVIPFVTVVGLLCLIGIIGNLLTIVVILRNRILQTTSNYLVSMAFSDLLILLLTGPMEVAYELQAWPWTYTRFMCRLRYFLIEACTFTSVLNITSFTTERYVAICHPIKAKTFVSHSRAIKIIVVIWIFSLSVSIPLFLGFDTYEICPGIAESTVCSIPTPEWNNIIDRLYIVSATLLFLIPMILITIFYSLIARVLYGVNVGVAVRRNSRRARNRNGVNNNDKKENSIERSRRQIVKMLDTGMLMFSDNLDDMTDMNNAAGIYLPPGADETDKKSEFLALEEEDDKDLFNIEDDLDQLLSDVVKKPQKPTEKPSLKPKPPSSPTKKTITAHRPTPAPRPAGKPGKAPPKPAPRKDKTPSAGGSETEETTKKDEPIETMDDGDIMKYIQENAGEENASLDLF